MNTLYIKDDMLIGDLIMTIPALREYKLANPETKIVYLFGKTPSWQLLFNNPIFDGLIDQEDFLKIDPDWKTISFDCGKAMSWGMNNHKSMVEGYSMNLFNLPISSPVTNIFLTDDELTSCKKKYELDWSKVVIVARHSRSCTSNDPKILVPNKCINNKTWVEVANYLTKKGLIPVAIGGKEDEFDPAYMNWPGLKIYGRKLREVSCMLKLCKFTISIDTGIRHMAAAVGGNLLTLTGAIPLWLINCVANKPYQKVIEKEVDIRSITSKDIKQYMEILIQ